MLNETEIKESIGEPPEMPEKIESGITLTDEQQGIVDSLMNWVDDHYNGSADQYTTMAGLAGTGKTTVLGFLADALREKRAYTRIGFITYTGKASIVLGSKLYNMGPDDYVGTIHSLIYFPIVDEETGKIEGWSKRDFLDVDFIFVDEASMVGKDIWDDLLEYRVPIIAIGDHGQLPPVSADSFNLMEDPEFVLTEIHRQAKDNPIIQLSMTARDEGYIDCGMYGTAIAKLHWTDPRCKKILNAYDKDTDLICLCGMNRTRVQVNNIIRKNHGFKGQPKVGERLICLKNNKNVNAMNGQIGTLKAIKSIGSKFYEIQMRMDGSKYDIWLYVLKSGFGKAITKDAYAESNMMQTRHELADEMEKKGRKEYGEDYYIPYEERKRLRVDLFDFGYCVSVHKSQGSEWSRVIMIDERNSYQSDDDYSRWLYTGITRAKDKLIMIEDF
jgi:ATP-dependent exoDNAse (exonuclease V) alpha subunit